MAISQRDMEEDTYLVWLVKTRAVTVTVLLPHRRSPVMTAVIFHVTV
jgi:hypothetical protein